MRILIIGGTGFIGYHAVQALLKNGHQVSVIGIPPLSIPNLLPNQVQIHFLNIEQASDQALKETMRGQDVFVFAAGADDRNLPDFPAYDYFFRANVHTTSRIIKLAGQSGIKRGIIISSYFAHFDRLWPEMKLSQHHPYIRSRIHQEQQAFLKAPKGMELLVLELPFVFGAMPGNTPLWAPLIRYIRFPFPLLCPQGGTNAMAVSQAAKAILGALERGKDGETYVIGGENLSYSSLLKRLMNLMGIKKRIFILPNWLIRASMVALRTIHRIRGKESGLDPVIFVDLLTKETFFDPTHSRTALGYGKDDLDAALKATIKACS
jgi:nucleoside-diphosphate-sugar epimerase